MNLFEIVKYGVSCREAAELYGVEVNRYGMALCPFHNDRHPSLYVADDHYHCFACGEHGDVIDFVSKLFQLSVRPPELSDFFVEQSAGEGLQGGLAADCVFRKRLVKGAQPCGFCVFMRQSFLVGFDHGTKPLGVRLLAEMLPEGPFAQTVAVFTDLAAETALLREPFPFLGGCFSDLQQFAQGLSRGTDSGVGLTERSD